VQRLRVGASTPLELAQAQRDLVESQLAELQAMIEYRLARVELYRCEGSLLERRGLSVSR
jgi:outer membrane protein TolC